MDTLNRLEESSTHHFHIINFIEESIKKENFKYIAFGRNIDTYNDDIEPNLIFEIAKIKLESYLKMVKQYMNEPIYQNQDIDNKIKRIENYLNSKYILQNDTHKDKNIEINRIKALCIEDDISKNLNNETKGISVDIESTMIKNYVDLNNKLDQQTIPIEDLNLNNNLEYNNKVLLDNNLINEKLKEDLLVLAGEMKNSALKFGKLMEKDKEVLLSIDNQQIINIEQTSKSIYELKNYSRYIIFIKCQSIPWLKGYQGYQRNIKSSYDFIIVGAGASGCALARTLADAKYSVLLIERGGTRVEGSELSLSVDGAGRVIDDNKVSQSVITNNGVRTNIGIGLGGGTAINMGIVIKEDPNFFNLLEAYSGAKLNMSLLEESYDWIIKNVSNRSDQSIPIVEPLKEAFGDIGFITDENKNIDFILSKINGTWRTYNIFNTSDNNFRMASDVLLADIQAVKDNSIIEKSPVDILTNHVVTKIELTNETSRNTNNFRSNPTFFLPYQFPNLDGFIKNEIRQDTSNMNQTSLVATCVLLNKVNTKNAFPDISGNSSISNFFSTINSVSNWAESFVPNQEWKFGVNIASSADMIGNILAKRICVNKGGMIILSAGTIFTPLLLYRSGIGPIDRLKRLNVSPILNVPNLGTNMVDRLLYAIPIFIRKDVQLNPFINPLMASISDDVKKDCGYNCDVINIESIGGGRIVEGTLYATRLIFPPSLRSNIVTNFLIDLFKLCANFAPASNINPACIILEYPIQCLRRSVAIFYFQGEPKSRATIEVDNYGKVSLSGNYLHNNEDQLNAIKGISSLIKMIKSGKFDNVAEPGGYQSCPFAILNGMLNIVGSMRSNQEDYGQPRTSAFSEAIENIFFALTSYRLSIMPQTCINDNNSEQCKSNVNYERIATFPPLLPNLDDPQKILSFAQKIGTSLWHWAGAAPLGEIVENDSFILSGTKNLGVVDASLLKILPRVNPMISIMAIGRYAGLSILNNKSKNKD
ncbi:hypothetical protein ACR3K2_16050 [Cryptosporidium serpentis]